MRLAVAYEGAEPTQQIRKEMQSLKRHYEYLNRKGLSEYFGSTFYVWEHPNILRAVQDKRALAERYMQIGRTLAILY